MDTFGNNPSSDPIRHSPLFQGRFTVPVEQASGRLPLPLKWRPKEPDDWFGIILWPIGVESHLLVMPPARWNHFLQYVYDRAHKESELSLLEPVLGETSDIVHVDKVGRITIRDDLLKSIGIEKEAILRGRMTRWEIHPPKGGWVIKEEDKKLVGEFLKDYEL